ncbi:MAG: leucine-rich repeat domain-containing protein [Spirochaetaceae bacterium]|jgi:hypothetical protein|nr:leucine-rich repeat domain-containing protein [Spirochaetaceae bacterium]
MRKNFLSFFIIVAGLAGSLFAQDSKLFVTSVEVEGSTKSLVITGYNGTEKAIVIPASIDGLPVRKIGDGAFRLKGLTGVVIPNGVEAIGNQAFFGNQLELVIIPPSVKVISDSAFDSNMLERVTSGNVPVFTDTPDTTPADSLGTASSVKPRLRIYYISVDKLHNRGQIPGTDIVLNYGDFYNPLTGFDGSYKHAHGSRKVLVPQKDKDAKEASSTPVLVLPADKIYSQIDSPVPDGNSGIVFFINEGPGPQSAYVTVGENAKPPPSPPVDYGAHTGNPVNHIIKLQPDGGIGRAAYRGRGFNIIVIPEGTTYIGEAAFYSNNLTSVKIPDSVRLIGGQAFMGNNLSSITIGENVTVQYDSFRYQFSDYYRMNKFKAGTYILKAGHWNYEGNENKHKFVETR